MTKLELVISSNFKNYVQNYALAQRKEVEDLDFDKIYDRYLLFIDTQKEKQKNY